MNGLRGYLAGLNDGPGGTTGPKPCRDCGAPRSPGLGRGRVYCDDCQRERDRVRQCRRCGGPKPPGRGRRLCDECQASAYGVSPCKSCGERAPKAVKGGKYCADCRGMMREVAEARQRARLRSRVKVCRGGCGRRGPFRKESGAITPYCTACRPERFAPKTCQRCGVKPIRAKHTRLCAACKQLSLIDKRQRARKWDLEHPEKAAQRTRRSYERRELQRIAEDRRITRALAREMRDGVTLVPRATVPGRGADSTRFPKLPAGPLAAAVEDLIRRESPRGMFKFSETGQMLPPVSAREAVCERIGISSRNLYAWGTGERADVCFDIADRVLSASELCWWDVWKPCGASGCLCKQCEGATLARLAFEGAVAA